MNDPHDRFTAWLTAGAPGEPPRDAAIHASGCAGCQRLVAAFDALLAIDAGAADVPPRGLADPGRPRGATMRVARVAAGAAAVVLVGTAFTIGVGSLLPRTNGGAPIGALATSTPAGEGVLAGAGGPGETAQPEPSPTATASQPDVTATPSPTDGAASTIPPAPVITPPPVFTPPVVTPRPSAAPKPTAAPTQPAPTHVPATPTPIPTPAPTSVPTPVPTEVPPTPAPTPPPASEEPVDP